MKIRQDMEGKQGTGLFGQIDNPTMNEFRGMLSSQLFDFLAKHYAAIRIQKCVGFVSGNEGTSLDYVKGYLEGLFYLFTVLGAIENEWIRRRGRDPDAGESAKP